MTTPDATLPLQKAAIDALRDDAAMQALVAGRVWSEPPTQSEPLKPYVTLGPVQVLADRAHDYLGGDISLQFDAWSNVATTAEVKKIARAMVAALDRKPLQLAENQRLVLLEWQDTQLLREPDGKTHHAAVTFRALTEPTA